MTRAVFVGLVALVALAPLPFASNRPWSWSLLSLAVGALLIGWAVAAAGDRAAVGVGWRKTWPGVTVFAAIVAWIAAQASPLTPAAWHHPLWRDAAAALGEPLAGAVSLDPAATWTALMRLVAYAGVFWLALQLGASSRRARAMMWSVALAGFVYCVYGLVVTFGGFDTILWYERWAYRDSLSSTFVNRNAFATYAGLALLATLGLLFDSVRRGGGSGLAGLRWAIEGVTGRLGMLGFMALVIASALLLTNSRGGLLSALVGLTVLAVAFTAFSGRRLVAAAAALAGTALFVAAVIWLSGDRVIERFDSTVESAEQRWSVYVLVARAIADNPWRGVGYGAFERAFPLIRDASVEVPSIYDKAHNSYLEFAFEAGVPAFVAMLGLLAGLAGMCLRGAWRRREGRLYPAVGLAAAALVGSHALVDFSIQMPAVAAAFALLLGAGCAQSLPRRRSAPEAPRRAAAP